MFSKRYSCYVPADVPKAVQKEFCKNYQTITKNADRLMLFVYDHKMEHLNNDCIGTDNALRALNPEHIFSIAQQGKISAFATHFGLIARYGNSYPDIPYIAKLTGKTHLIKTEQQDPYSYPLWTVENVVTLKKETTINICGVGCTVYLGSEHEGHMMANAAQIISQAHRFGLITILWVYVKGKAITDEFDPHLVAGAAGLATTLGADFVKIKPPHQSKGTSNIDWLQNATQSAGNTKVICAGGPKIDPQDYFTALYEQLHQTGIAGCAVGRNIFTRSLPEAIAMTHAVNAMTYDNKNAQEALTIYNKAKI